ncbi:MAG: hypothetical protein WBH68_06075 [Erysipelotrichaceae bacterium]|jgi:mannose/fructose-specific phosphotransferase system component IIA|nr:PTS sugar transporter subunit IIA [Bacillota bacterium]NLP22872.1 PTS sugar transporter subunit IIA [Erysipelotrichaceae bacterium]HCY05892.1 PTS sugar transporter subunit IIA [Erysipelotrichaceae bacterium]
MLKIFLSSHGHFASGLKSSLDILIGNSDVVTVFDAYIDEKTVQEQLELFYEKTKEDDQILLLSDLYGGSVNQVMATYLDRPNTTLVAGVNLAFVLEVATKEKISEEELEIIIKQSRNALKQVKLEEIGDEEDFF